MGGDRSARTLYGLSPYADSVRTQTAHFVSYSSAYVPERCLMSAYSLRIHGFIRGSIPLSSTIKRLVRRGSGKANGQKPKMYGHADRIDGQDKGSGKLPVLLDCCVLTAYSWCMTTPDTTQRDELARDIFIADNSAHPNAGAEWDAFEDIGGVCGGDYAYDLADGLLAAGYRKPRTIETAEYGVTYVSEAGDLHTDWGYSSPPGIDKDGEIEVGKREWAKAYEIKSRPVTPETSVWQSDDCPWREATR